MLNPKSCHNGSGSHPARAFHSPRVARPVDTGSAAARGRMT